MIFQVNAKENRIGHCKLKSMDLCKFVNVGTKLMGFEHNMGKKMLFLE